MTRLTPATDEWLITGITADGLRKRFVLLDRSGITRVAERAESVREQYLGEKSQILTIANRGGQKARKEDPS